MACCAEIDFLIDQLNDVMVVAWLLGWLKPQNTCWIESIEPCKWRNVLMLSTVGIIFSLKPLLMQSWQSTARRNAEIEMEMFPLKRIY